MLSKLERFYGFSLVVFVLAFVEFEPEPEPEIGYMSFHKFELKPEFENLNLNMDFETVRAFDGVSYQGF